LLAYLYPRPEPPIISNANQPPHDGRHRGLLFILPDNFFSGYKRIAPIAEKTLTAFGTDLKSIATIGTVRIHIKFVIEGIAVTFFTKKLGPFGS
jgi:hypothetical protein